MGSALPAASIARASTRCSPSESASVVKGEVHAAKAPSSTRHSNRTSPLVGGQVERRRRVGRGAGGPVHRRHGRVGVDGEAPGRGRGVGVAGGVDGAHLERVGPVAQLRRGEGRAAGRVGAAVDAALERRAGRVGRELERRRGIGGGAARPRRDGRVGRLGVDGERRAAGVGSALPAASTARASNVCAPSASWGIAVGDWQGLNGPPSTRHSKVAPSSSVPRPNDGARSLVVGGGPERIVVSGASVSTVKVRVAGVGSALPAGSIARTSKVCSPSARSPAGCGDWHAANAPPSTRHSNVVPGLSPVNSNSGVASPVGPDGPAVMLVCGGSVSTVKVREAGEGSVLPAGSTARTSSVWRPSSSRPVVNGEVQDAKAPSSTRHSKPEPGSSAAISKVGVASAVGPPGPAVIVVSGGSASTVKVRVGGRRVGVAGAVGGADVERVRTVGEARERQGRGAGRERAAVDPALEGRAGLPGGELEVGARLARGAGRPRRDRRLRRRGVDREGAGDGRRVGVAGGVDGPRLERVLAVGERVDLRGRAAGREGGAVDPALELRARLVRGRARTSACCPRSARRGRRRAWSAAGRCRR